MSLLLKSELRLRLGQQHCEAAIWRAGLKSRRIGHAVVQGPDGDPIEQVLALLLAQGHALPAAASVCVEDELLYYATFPALGYRNHADSEARKVFAGAAAEAGLLIQTSLAPCGRTWIAAALDAGWVEQLRRTLIGHDIELRHLRGALLEDMVAIGPEFGAADGVVAMLRKEGTTLVGVQTGCIADIAWERCDMTTPSALATRVQGYRTRFAHKIGRAQSSTGLAVLLVPGDADQQALLASLAQAQGWRMARSVLAPDA